MDSQLKDVLPALESTESRLWERRSPGEWSAGEQLDHMISIHAFFTTLYRVFWLPSSCLARLRPSRPCSYEIDDIYKRPGFPLGAGSLWAPSRHSALKSPLELLVDDLRERYRHLRRFYSSKPEGILGRAPLFYPYVGWISYIQSLRIGIHHDAHHFASIMASLLLYGQ